VEALRTDNRWLEYQLRAVRDELLDQGAHTAEGGSAVDMVRVALLERDEAPQKACEALTVAQTVAAEKEMTLASAQAQLQQDCTTLEGARSCQSQAEEKAKEAERLWVDLADKVASLAAVGEQLHQEKSARQQAENQLQQEWSALKEVQAALERERLAREEVQGHLQWERAALEKAHATIKLQDEEVTWLFSELVQGGVSYEDLRQASEEKDTVILELQQAAATVHATLESEKKQVEGELLACLSFVG
jgi:chromosome segregation ATPase